MSEPESGFEPVLERWATDDDLWIRRSALLAHLRPPRAERGDFEQFMRFADTMLDEREFLLPTRPSAGCYATPRRSVLTWCSTGLYREVITP